MFQTLQPETFRINKTSIPGKRLKLNLSIDVEQRPRTMDIDSDEALFTPKEILLRTIDDARIEITKSFGKQMNPYIKQKIRSSLSRNHKRKVLFDQPSLHLQDPQEFNLKPTKKFFNQTLESIKYQSPGNIKHMKISAILNRQLRSPFKEKQLISEQIVINTKQKIDRLIGLKKQQQLEYQQLKKSIESKCLNLRRNTFRRMSMINPMSDVKPRTMQTLDWDQQWKQEVRKQSNRYRNRLIAKHKRDMSIKIQLPQTKFNIS